MSPQLLKPARESGQNSERDDAQLPSPASEQMLLSPPGQVSEETDRDLAASSDSPGGIEREYECIQCGYTAETFIGGCPVCGANAFTTGRDAGERNVRKPSLVNEILAPVARATAPWNPYVPR